MKWSWKIARLAGIDVRIHATFVLILIWVAASQWNIHGTVQAAFNGILFVLALFGCIVLHELGHALTARRYGIPTRDITLLPIGGVASMEKMPEKPGQEIRVALAGPAVNIIIAGILYLLLDISNAQIDFENMDLQGVSFIFQLLVLNVFLALFNLIPAFPMDGGRVLRASLAYRMERSDATQKAASIGQLFAIAFGIFGFFYNPFLILIAVFIWFAGSAEAGSEKMKHSLSGASIRHAMLTNFYVLSPTDTLAQAIDYTIAGTQTSFPVGREGHIDGVLTQEAMLRGIQEHGPDYPVGQLQLEPIRLVEIDTLLTKMLEQVRTRPNEILGVTEGSRIVGLVDITNIIELIKIQDSIHNNQARHQAKQTFRM